MKQVRGFTLLELMVVVAIIAILATIGLNSYQKQVRKSRRAEAKQVLADLGLREEKYRSSNTTYGTCDQAMVPSTCAALNGTLKYYTVALANNTAAGYAITATPTGDQLKDSCGTLTWTQSATGVLKTPITGGCW